MSAVETVLRIIVNQNIMIGAIGGDIIGSVYEFDNIKTTDFPLFTNESDDGCCS